MTLRSTSVTPCADRIGSRVVVSPSFARSSSSRVASRRVARLSHHLSQDLSRRRRVSRHASFPSSLVLVLVRLQRFRVVVFAFALRPLARFSLRPRPRRRRPRASRAPLVASSPPRRVEWLSFVRASARCSPSPRPRGVDRVVSSPTRSAPCASAPSRRLEASCADDRRRARAFVRFAFDAWRSFAIATRRRRTSDARAMAREGKARASHVLVKHADSRRPASWRDPEGAHIAKKARGARGSRTNEK